MVKVKNGTFRFWCNYYKLKKTFIRNENQILHTEKENVILWGDCCEP